MSQEIDYTKVLADLEARRAALDTMIAGVKKVILGQLPADAAGGAGGPGAGASSQELPKDVVPGVFHGMSVSEAAKKFLEMKKAKQKTRVLCDALVQGGIESDSKNFYSNVYTTLSRNREFMRRGKYWALAGWFPNVSTAKPAKKTRRANKKDPKLAATASKKKVPDISLGADKAGAS